MAGDIDVSNPEGDLARGDHVDLLGRFVIVGECCDIEELVVGDERLEEHWEGELADAF